MKEEQSNSDLGFLLLLNVLLGGLAKYSASQARRRSIDRRETDLFIFLINCTPLLLHASLCQTTSVA